MAAHNILLDADQERALTGLATRAQDALVTPDSLLASLVTRALEQPVAELLRIEGDELKTIYVADAVKRVELSKFLSVSAETK